MTNTQNSEFHNDALETITCELMANDRDCGGMIIEPHWNSYAETVSFSLAPVCDNPRCGNLCENCDTHVTSVSRWDCSCCTCSYCGGYGCDEACVPGSCDCRDSEYAD